MIPFNRAYISGNELDEIAKALAMRTLQGDGYYTKQCHDWFIEKLSCDSAFLTSSCTLALDMASVVAGFGPGDEVLVPDFTFVSTAQCVALRGATPVLCDIRPDTLNLDEQRLEEAITDKTRGVIPIHYAGMSAEMETICKIADKHGLTVIEDAAQAVGSKFHGKPVGTYGAMSAFSFHGTKNIQCGEGGLLAVNSPDLTDACAVAWEKGTDRRQFLEGNLERYQWKSLGSSFLTSEISAAMLWSQLNIEKEITRKRCEIWERYHSAFADAEQKGLVTRPTVPEGVEHNGHLYYLILPDTETRARMIRAMTEVGVGTVFHYTPLHESDGGKKYCRTGMSLTHASSLPHRLIRLPLFPDLSDSEQAHVIASILEFLETL